MGAPTPRHFTDNERSFSEYILRCALADRRAFVKDNEELAKKDNWLLEDVAEAQVEIGCMVQRLQALRKRRVTGDSREKQT